MVRLLRALALLSLAGLLAAQARVLIAGSSAMSPALVGNVLEAESPEGPYVMRFRSDNRTSGKCIGNVEKLAARGNRTIAYGGGVAPTGPADDCASIVERDPASGAWSLRQSFTGPGPSTIAAAVVMSDGRAVAAQSSPNRTTMLGSPRVFAGWSVIGQFEAQTYSMSFGEDGQHGCAAGSAQDGAAASLFCTADGGASWQQRSPHKHKHMCERLGNANIELCEMVNVEFLPGSSLAALAVSRTGAIFRSSDGGTSWGSKPVAELPSRYGLPNSVLMWSATHGMVTGMGGGLRTHDGGLSWTELRLEKECRSCDFWAVAPLKDGQLCAVGSRNGNGDGLVYRSKDSGKKWTIVWQGMPNGTWDDGLYGVFGLTVTN